MPCFAQPEVLHSGRCGSAWSTLRGRVVLLLPCSVHDGDVTHGAQTGRIQMELRNLADVLPSRTSFSVYIAAEQCAPIKRCSNMGGTLKDLTVGTIWKGFGIQNSKLVVADWSHEQAQAGGPTVKTDYRNRLVLPGRAPGPGQTPTQCGIGCWRI